MPDAAVPVRADHRPDHGAVPERHPDPPGAEPGPSSADPRPRCIPTWPARTASATATWWSCAPAAGTAVFRATVTDAIRPDTVFVPFHWGGASSGNALTNPALDPHSKMPAFKVCAVRGPARRPRRRPPDHPTADATQAMHRTADAHPAPPTDAQPAAPPDSPEGHSMTHHNRFLQGIYPFEGRPRQARAPGRRARYTVPAGVITQPVYFRGGNTTDELISVVLMRDGMPMRYFPIGAKADVHVPLRVVEDLDGGTVIELAPGRARRASPARSSSTSAWWRSDDVCMERDRLGLQAHGSDEAADWWSSATAWRAPAPSRRSSPAAAPSSSTSPCSATSRTATTTASCCPTCCPARRRGRDLPQQPALVRRQRHHPARRRPDHPDRPVRQAGVRRGRHGHPVRQADHRHRQPRVRARRWRACAAPTARFHQGVFAFRTLDDTRGDDRVRRATTSGRW